MSSSPGPSSLEAAGLSILSLSVVVVVVENMISRVSQLLRVVVVVLPPINFALFLQDQNYRFTDKIPCISNISHLMIYVFDTFK